MENVYKIKIKLENIWIDLIMGIYVPYKYVYSFRFFFEPTGCWVQQFALSFLSFLLGSDFLDSHSLSP